MHFQPNSEHFGSFKTCLRHSATASDKIEGFSGEVMVRSNANNNNNLADLGHALKAKCNSTNSTHAHMQHLVIYSVVIHWLIERYVGLNIEAANFRTFIQLVYKSSCQYKLKTAGNTCRLLYANFPFLKCKLSSVALLETSKSMN